MVTGDHKVTALSIAKRLNISKDDDEAIEESEIDENVALDILVNEKNVFARVSPHTKLNLLKLWK